MNSSVAGSTAVATAAASEVTDCSFLLRVEPGCQADSDRASMSRLGLHADLQFVLPFPMLVVPSAQAIP